MFVYNNCRADVRVLKEAAVLREAGHEVRIVAILDATTEPHETKDGIRVDRIDRNPPHYTLLRVSRRGRRAIRLSRARLLRATRGRLRRIARRRARLTRRLERRYRRFTRRPAAAAPTAAAPAAARGPAAEQVVEVTRLDTPTAQRQRPLLERALLVMHRPLMFMDFYLRALQLCRREPSDVYHAHDLNTLPVAVAASRATGGRLIYDAHELYTEISTLSARERFVWRQLERLLIRRADARLSVCDSIADELASRYGVPKPRVLLNCPERTPAVALRPHALRQAAGIDGGTPLVLYQGGFAPHRGLEQLVLAAEHMNGATLVLMGWGRIEDDLRRLVAGRRLDDRVRILPPVSQQDLLSFTAGADVGVIPYQAVGLNNFYTTPNKLFEYMAAGVPIAASRFPELIRFVEGLEIGSTFDERDPLDIARTISALLADDGAREAMRQRALDAAERFSWEREREKLVDLYATL